MQYSFLRPVFLPLTLIAVLFLTPLHRSFGQAEALSQQGQDLFNAGQYEQAAEIFEQIIRDYPTSALRSDAEMRAGYAHFLNGEYDKAIEQLTKVLDPPAPAALQEIAASIIPQAISAKASGMEADAPEREKTFEEAIAKFTTYLEKYPEADEAEVALYGRSIAYYNMDKLDEAAADLRSNLTRFAKSRSVLDSQYFLALILATQANRAMSEDAAANQAAAAPKYVEAEKLLQGIVERGTDVALANDATFQLGELNFNRAIFSDGDERRAFFDKAVNYYRQVQPKEPMVAAQNRLIEELNNQRREIVQRRDGVALRQLQSFIDRETTKLAALQEKPDQTIEAKLRTAQVFFQLEDHDATRVIVRYLNPFLEGESQKRTALYLNAMSYALQNKSAEAVEAYNAFNEAFKGAEIADNLPLVLGTMFVSMGEADAAVPYLREQMEIYPDGRFFDMASMQLATAQAALGQTDAALTTFRTYLTEKPDGPADVRAQAEMGIATVLKDTLQHEDAIAAFNTVRENYPDMPNQQAMATFWMGYVHLQNANAASAITELNAFIEKFPDHDMQAIALFTLGQAQEAAGDTEAALATFTQVSEKFPDQEVGSFGYFQRAVILTNLQRNEEVIAVLREFMEKFPDDDKMFAAVDTIGQNLIASGDLAGAITNYSEFAEKFPEDAMAPMALLNVSNLQRQRANALGRYSALREEQRPEWQADMDASIENAEAVLEKYPESEMVALALQSLLEAQRTLLTFRLKDAPQVRTYFEDFAERFADSPAARSKVLFTLAAYVHEDDPAEALTIMKGAYDAELRYAPSDLDLYGLALITKGELDEAAAVFQKVATDYTNPPGVAAEQAPVDIQTAQSISLFGLGRIAQEREQVAEAAALFDQLKKTYPWSPKVLEADYGIAQALKAEGKNEEATALLGQIIRARTGAPLRANAMLLLAEIQEETGDTDAAIDNYIKIAQFYEAVQRPAAEGLWRGAQLLEKKIAATTDAALRQKLTKNAVDAYQNLVTKYPSSEHAPEAQKRLSALRPAS